MRDGDDLGEQWRELVQTRAGITQSFGRLKNERSFAEHHSSNYSEYACECFMNICAETVSMAVDEYEQVRSVPTHFVVAPGHVDSRVEIVVWETERFVVVEKIGIAAEVASRLVPVRVAGPREREL